MIQAFFDPKKIGEEEFLRIMLDNHIGWIEMSTDVTESQLDKIEEFCKEHGIILTIFDNTPLLLKRRFHGIVLDNSLQRVITLREDAGGHPIIGIHVKPGDDPLPLRPADIDFLTIDMDRQNEDNVTAYVLKIKSQWNIPVVARIDGVRDFEIERLLLRGFDGICVKDPYSLNRKNNN